MTIILATSEIMLADSHASWGNVRTSDPQKVRRFFNESCLVGAAGEWGLCDTFFAWYADKEHQPLASDSQERIEVLIVQPDGIFWSDGRSKTLHPIHEHVWAIGSGMDIALGAIWAGATLLDAVAITCERATSCLWPIQWCTVHKAGGVVTREAWQRRTDLSPLVLAYPCPRE